jgi:hypothetical protein
MVRRYRYRSDSYEECLKELGLATFYEGDISLICSRHTKSVKNSTRVDGKIWFSMASEG